MAVTTLVIRLRKEDTAYVYAILEANEGIAAYSTLNGSPGDRHRDLELLVPDGFTEEMDRLLGILTVELKGEMHVVSRKHAEAVRT